MSPLRGLKDCFVVLRTPHSDGVRALRRAQGPWSVNCISTYMRYCDDPDTKVLESGEEAISGERSVSVRLLRIERSQWRFVRWLRYSKPPGQLPGFRLLVVSTPLNYQRGAVSERVHWAKPKWSRRHKGNSFLGIKKGVTFGHPF